MAAPTHAAPPPPLGISARIGYGSGALVNGIALYVLGGQVLQLYFNQVIGLPAVAVGAMLMVTIIVDAVIDPLIGWWSDNLRSPWGRRHVLMYASALPTALGVFLIWRAPAALDPIGLTAFVIVMLLFVRISASLFEIPSIALSPELAPGYDERTSLMAWRFMFLVVGGAGINALLYQVFLREDAANPLGILNRQRYADFGALTAVIVLLVIVGSSLSTHRRIRHLYVPQRKTVTLGRTLRELKLTFTSRSLAILMTTNLLIAIAAGVTGGLASYMYIHLWRLKPQDIGLILMLGPFASFISLWATPRLAARFDKKRVMLGFYGSWLVTAIIPFSLWLAGLAPASGSRALLIFLVADSFVGVGLAVGVHIVLNSMLSDASEEIAVQSDLRSEGVMFAAYGLLAKWGTGIGAFLAGLLLEFVKFPDKAVPGTVPMELMRSLVIVNLPTITVFNLAAIACVSLYAVDRAKHEENLAILRARAAAPEADTLAPEVAIAQAAVAAAE